MASKNEINEENQSKLELREMRTKFPSGGLTLKEFCDIYSSSDDEDSLRMGTQKNDYCKFLFEAIDQGHSGKIDLYEYILGAALLEKNDPQVWMKCLFQRCDSNHDGLITYSEIENIVSMFFMTSDDNNFETIGQNENQSRLNEIMTVVRKAFGDKAQISEQEFAKLSTESEELKEIARVFNDNLVISLSYATGKFIE